MPKVFVWGGGWWWGFAIYLALSLKSYSRPNNDYLERPFYHPFMITVLEWTVLFFSDMFSGLLGGFSKVPPSLLACQQRCPPLRGVCVPAGPAYRCARRPAAPPAPASLLLCRRHCPPRRGSCQPSGPGFRCAPRKIWVKASISLSSE